MTLCSPLLAGHYVLQTVCLSVRIIYSKMENHIMFKLRGQVTREWSRPTGLKKPCLSLETGT